MELWPMATRMPHVMNLEKTVHTAIDELRMQMLGTQVLFGFQYQGIFQERFAFVSREGRYFDLVALSLIVLTLGLLLAGPSQHRLVEKGMVSVRLLRATNRFAECALAPFAVAIGCDLFVVLEPYLGKPIAAAEGLVAGTVALLLWYAVGVALRQLISNTHRERPMFKPAGTTLHEKIDQMLTEARVILPGVQAMLGFQFVVTLTKEFSQLPEAVRDIHFTALSLIALSMMLLLTPATIHRLAFHGMDVEQFHDIGSAFVTAALLPLAAGLALDSYVAVIKMLDDKIMATVAAAAIALVLLIFWYALPLLLRLELRRNSKT